MELGGPILHTISCASTETAFSDCSMSMCMSYGQRKCPRGYLGPMTEFCKCINVFHFSVNSKLNGGDFLAVQWLRSMRGSAGSIPGQSQDPTRRETKKKKKKNPNTKQKQYCNSFNKDFEKRPTPKKKYLKKKKKSNGKLHREMMFSW